MIDQEPNFQIEAPIQTNGSANPEDVLRAKKALAELGYYDTPDGGIGSFVDGDMFRAIESFQIDHDLVADALMLPGGETEQEIRSVIRSKRSGDKTARARYRPLPQIHDPVGRGIQRDDSSGKGFFQARRGKHRLHDGLDLEAIPGMPVVSPIDGVIENRTLAYKKKVNEKYPERRELRAVHIRGTGEYEGLTATPSVRNCRRMATARLPSPSRSNNCRVSARCRCSTSRSCDETARSSRTQLAGSFCRSSPGHS